MCVADRTDEQELTWRQLGKFLAENEQKASRKSMQISSVGTQAWEEIRESQGFTVQLWPQNIVPPKESSLPIFSWDERQE